MVDAMRLRSRLTAVLVPLLTALIGAAPAAAGPPVAVSPPVRAPAAADQRFDWPLRPRPPVLRPFDEPTHDWLPGHRGVDLGAAPGSTVRAAGAGIVTFAGTVAGRPVVSIRHDGGLRTTYEPVAPAVAAGDRVARGDPIGTLDAGHAGCAAAACLHWGARRDATPRARPDYVDPLALLRLAPLRLKPLAAGTSGGA